MTFLPKVSFKSKSKSFKKISTQIVPAILIVTSGLFYTTDTVQGKPIYSGLEGDKTNYVARKFLRPVSRTRAKVVNNGTQINITQNGNIAQSIKVSSLSVRAINSVNCQTGQTVPSQKLSAQRVYPQAVSLDQKTGNLVVGAVMQSCFDSQMSAVFIIQPQRNWKSYAIYRVRVPGRTQLPDGFSTHLLRRITKVGYFGSDLLVKHGDASGSAATLIFTPSRTPAGKYAGCVITNPGESRNICPTGI